MQVIFHVLGGVAAVVVAVIVMRKVSLEDDSEEWESLYFFL